MFDVNRILVPVDFGSCSRRALQLALQWHCQPEARMQVLHVFRQPDQGIPAVAIAGLDGVRQQAWEFARAEAWRDLAAMLQEAGAGRRAVPLLRSGDPTEEILSEARRKPYDLIIMGTHGRSGISHLLLGSVAERVIRLAPCPVLTVPPERLAPRATAAPAA